MPKIINVTKEEILKKTSLIIDEKRYEDLNCRQIAKEVGIGVGTLYHFFKSKSEVIATLLLEDWTKAMNRVEPKTEVLNTIEVIYNSIYDFAKNYFSFLEYSKKNFSEYLSYIDRHYLLINQISSKIKESYEFNGLTFFEEEVFFLSESILINASRLEEYAKLKKIFIKLI